MSDIIQKLNTLKSVHPSEKLVVEMREEVLSKAPVFYDLERNHTKTARFNLNNLFASKMAVSFATILFVLTGGLSASYASKSSLPGDTLYSVKIASENVVLAIASEDKKAEIEIEQAGKRLEELAEISKKPSDINQGEKLKKLAVNFEEKVNKAQDGLAKIEDNEKKAKIAKVINVQTEKYTEVLAVASENLTDVVKNDVSEKFASATDSNKKVNLDSLAVRIEVMTDEDRDEITAIVKEKVEKEAALEEETSSDGVNSSPSNGVDLSPSDGVDSSPSDGVNSSPSNGVDLSPRSNNSVSETTENTAETESSSDRVDLSPRSNSDDTSNTEQDLDTSEDIEDKVEENPTIEEEKEVLINLLDNLSSDPDNSNNENEPIKDNNSSDDGEDKGKTDGEDEADESDDKVMPVSIF